MADPEDAEVSTIARCKVCKVQWVSYARMAGEKESCAFCGAQDYQITYKDETPDFGGFRGDGGQWP